MFIYGPAGTGKTYVTHRLARLFRDVVLIPHAIAVDETIVQVFDPLLHKAVHCRRPAEHHARSTATTPVT